MHEKERVDQSFFCNGQNEFLQVIGLTRRWLVSSLTLANEKLMLATVD